MMKRNFVHKEIVWDLYSKDFNLFPNMSVLQNCKLAQVEVLNKTDEEVEKNKL